MRIPQQKAKGNTRGTRPKPSGQVKKVKIIHQVAMGAFPMVSVFLPFHPSDFSLLSVLPYPLIVILIRREAITLPNPGQTTSKMLSKSQSSFSKKASGLCVSGGGMGAKTTSDRP
jgi:hypothetical protein